MEECTNLNIDMNRLWNKCESYHLWPF